MSRATPAQPFRFQSKEATRLEPNLFRYVWRHSRRDQLLVLAVVLISLPFYFASFDLPKRIINDALQGKAFQSGASVIRFLELTLPLPGFLGGPVQLFSGFLVTQMQLLFGLSFLFLGLVIINGAFKFYINLSKGILGERLLRRMRYELFALYLRFKPEDIRTVRPSEAASIIKDEVEPIGGFTGDAFIQPAFLVMQALTAMLFIMVQSIWLGLVALAIVVVQGVVIPQLRKEQLRLARLRQIESRKLAGRIGEVIEIAPAVHVGGSAQFVRADLGERLGTLLKIRTDLFKRKFAVKYLNNFLAQITPFFFYSIGGYLALTGAMNIGQLVAVIAAYRDLPPPIKELIDWDQERNDVTVKYQQIVAQFPAQLIAEDGDDRSVPPPLPDQSIQIDALKVVDRRGTVVLEPMSAVLARPGHIALIGSNGSGRDVLARVLGRQVSVFSGKLTVGPVSWRNLPDSLSSRFLSYAGPDPLLFSGTLRDNISAPVMRRMPDLLAQKPEAGDFAEVRRQMEALRSGNPLALPSDDWFDLKAAGLNSLAERDAKITALLAIAGMSKDIARFGLGGRLDPDREPVATARIQAARETIRANLAARGLQHVVAPLDPKAFNRNATLSENLLFGLAISEQFQDEHLAANAYVRSILEAEALLYPLAEIGLQMAQAVIEIFADLPPGHPLFERFSFISSEDMPKFVRIVENVEARGSLNKLSVEAQSQLIGLAFSYVEPRHRMSAISPHFERRVLRARQSLRRYLPQAYTADIEFFDPKRYLKNMPIRDNLLFGRVSYGVARGEEMVDEVMNDVLRELGLEDIVRCVALDFDVGPGGKLLSNQQRASVALARALIARPELLVVDGALSVFGAADAAEIVARLRQTMASQTLVVTFLHEEDAAGFDQFVMFEGARMVSLRKAAVAEATEAAPALQVETVGS